MDYKKLQKKLCASCLRDIKTILSKCDGNKHTFGENSNLAMMAQVGVDGWNPVIKPIKVVYVKLQKNGRVYVKLNREKCYSYLSNEMDIPNDLFDIYEALCSDVCIK